MSRLSMPALLAALVLVLAGSATAAERDGQSASSQSPVQESGSPIADQGSNFNYRSLITSVSPSPPGLSVEVLEFADRLLLRNHTGKTITVYGYSGEPYARIQANGTAEQNVRSPAVYLNTNFYADVTVPPSANPSAPPKWVVVDRTGQFEWHDHRIHWMSPATPPQVKDKGRRTKIFDWRVPISVGAQTGAVNGQLFWVPESSKTPLAAIVAFVVILLAGIVFVLIVRRRRAHDPPAPPGGDGGSGRREAW
jgi:hypothetical protein